MALGSDHHFITALGHLLTDYLIAYTGTERKTKAIYAICVDRQFFYYYLGKIPYKDNRSIVSC